MEVNAGSAALPWQLQPMKWSGVLEKSMATVGMPGDPL